MPTRTRIRDVRSDPSQRRRLPSLGAILAIVLTAGPPAVAQSRHRTPDTQKPRRGESPQVRPAYRDLRADVSPVPRVPTPRRIPRSPPRPARGDHPAPDPQARPRYAGQPAAGSARPPRPTPQPRPDLSRAPAGLPPPSPGPTCPGPSRPDYPDRTPRPDLSRPTAVRHAPPRPTRQLEVRRDIARPGPGPRTRSRPASRPPGSVQINTLAIIATNKDNRIDPSLRDLAAQLKPTFKFSGYRLARSDSSSVAAGPARLPAAGRPVRPAGHPATGRRPDTSS